MEKQFASRILAVKLDILKNTFTFWDSKLLASFRLSMLRLMLLRSSCAVPKIFCHDFMILCTDIFGATHELSNSSMSDVLITN